MEKKGEKQEKRKISESEINTDEEKPRKSVKIRGVVRVANECGICHSSKGKIITTCSTDSFCGHHFHFACLKRWCNISGKTTCPICRQDINHYPNHIVYDPTRDKILKNRTEILDTFKNPETDEIELPEKYYADPGLLKHILNQFCFVTLWSRIDIKKLIEHNSNVEEEVVTTVIEKNPKCIFTLCETEIIKEKIFPILLTRAISLEPLILIDPQFFTFKEKSKFFIEVMKWDDFISKCVLDVDVLNTNYTDMIIHKNAKIVTLLDHLGLEELLENTDFLTEVLNKNPFILLHIDYAYLCDLVNKKTMKKEIYHFFQQIIFLDPERALYKYRLSNGPFVNQFIREEYDFLKKFLSLGDPNVIEYLPEFQNKKHLMAKVVQRNGRLYQFMGNRLKGDLDLAEIAMNSNVNAYKFLTPAFKKNQAFLEICIAKKFCELPAHVPQEVKSCDKFYFDCIERLPHSPSYFEKKVFTKKDIIEAIAYKQPFYFKYATSSLRKNKEFILYLLREAQRRNKTSTYKIIEDCHYSIKQDMEIAKAACTLDGGAFKYLSYELKRNLNLAKLSMETNPSCVKYFDESLFSRLALS